MKNIRKTLILFLALVVGGCYDFEEININPNEPTSVPTSQLLTSAQRNLVKEVFGNNSNFGESSYANIYMQYLANLRGGFDGIYLDVQSDFADFYQEGLIDLQEIIRLNNDPELAVSVSESGSNNNQIAVARILRAWAFSNITDIWGDIPYFEALAGLDQVLPTYDPQELIYEDLIKELSEASTQIELEGTPVEGDIIFGGDMENWQLLANALKMRLGLRLSKVDPAMAQEVVQEAYQAGLPSDNSQNALYRFSASAGNNNPMYYRFFISVPNLGVSNTMVDKLIELNDPRLAYYADVAALGDNAGEYIGMPYGIDRSKGSGIRDEAVSWPDAEKVLGAASPFTILSYAEVSFMKAEAASRGWIDGDAETYYKTGIRASLEYWGVPEEQINTFMEEPSIAFNASEPLASIGEQKWISFYMQGIQAWSEWRRLGYPELAPAPDAMSGRSIPRRKGYPPSELTLNKANYDAAISRQGPDNMATRVWWDVE
ncbi:SusD/RagB family nutrient-binding outer membrane lipoprotein [Catalinimonas sp. 4WD22]|uniref:SusD/RagB family nutrient-binding outer membrane lipoprotein n=1 Tax=Catalinimonas locisalis TaxID=3133978 RepID=UPI00310117F7